MIRYTIMTASFNIIIILGNPQHLPTLHKRFDVFFRCGNWCNAVIFHQKIQNVRRQKRWKRRAKTDVFDTQMQKCQQDTDGLLFVPG